MHHQPDTIRPRRRRRVAPTSGIPSRAEQSTRVLIRVPLMAGESTTASSVVQPTNVLPTSDACLATYHKTPRTDSGSAIVEVGPPRSISISAPEPSAVRQPSVAAAWRIDAAHLDAPAPHSAAPAWLGQRLVWLSGLLQFNSMIAIGVIAVAAVIAVIAAGRHAAQNEAKPTTNPHVNLNHSDQSTDLPARAASADAADNEIPLHRRYETSAAGPGIPAAADGTALAKPGDKLVERTLPAAVNTPASIGRYPSATPVGPTQGSASAMERRLPTSADALPNFNLPNDLPSYRYDATADHRSPAANEPIHTARRELSAAGAVGSPNSSAPKRGAAFEGVIAKPPAQVSR